MGSLIIRQHDFQTIRVERGPIKVLIRYSLFWSDQERLPESVAAQGENVTAYFLTMTIRDHLAEAPGGFVIERRWSVQQEGEGRLSFTLDLPDFTASPYLFPGKAEGPFPAEQEASADGWATQYPCALLLRREPESLLVFADPPSRPGEAGRVSLKKVIHDQESLARIELFFPAGPADASQGGFEGELRLNLVCAPGDRIFHAGLLAAMKRYAPRLQGPALRPRGAVGGGKRAEEALREGIKSCLKQTLLDKGGVCALRQAPGSGLLSALASAGIAHLVLLVFPEEEELEETALRCASFALKAQHPCGLFYDTCEASSGRWLSAGPDDRGPPLVGLKEASGIAEHLLRLALLLRRRGLASEAFFLAACHLVESFFAGGRRFSLPGSLIAADGSEARRRDLEALTILGPLETLFATTRRDRYRKAMLSLRDGLLARPPAPPARRSQEDAPDLEAALILGSAVLRLTRSGVPVRDVRQYGDLLLPWIYVNGPSAGSAPAGLNPVGGLRESLGGSRLLFAGYEAAHTFLKLNALDPGVFRTEQVRLLAAQMMGFTAQAPLGTDGFALSGLWEGGETSAPLDSRRFVREALSLLELKRDYPRLLP